MWNLNHLSPIQMKEGFFVKSSEVQTIYSKKDLVKSVILLFIRVLLKHGIIIKKATSVELCCEWTH